MEYTEVEINGLKWWLPAAIALKVASEQKEPNIGDIVWSARDASDYLEDLLDNQISLLEGKVVVDICSGLGNLDDLASHASSFIRVDLNYRYDSMVDSIKRKSKTPSKFTFNPSTGFALNLPGDCADLVLENYGLQIYYGPFKAFGSEGLQYFFDTGEDFRTNAMARTRFFLIAMAEKIRIARQGGTIIVGPIDENDYEYIVNPSLNKQREKGALHYSQCQYPRRYNGDRGLLLTITIDGKGKLQ